MASGLPTAGVVARKRNISAGRGVTAEGALVNWKNNPDGTRSPYERMSPIWMR